jgi:multidrug efflux system membrane fusion protein
MNMFTQEARLKAPTRKTGFLRLHWRWWVGAIAICILAAGAYVLYAKPGQAQSSAGKQGQNPAARSVPVVAVPSKTGDVGVYLNGLGSVTPLNTVTVKSPSTNVDESPVPGGRVVRAESAAEIDPRPFRSSSIRPKGSSRATRRCSERAAGLEAKCGARVRTGNSSIPRPRWSCSTRGAVKVDQSAIGNAKLQLAYSRIRRRSAAGWGGALSMQKHGPCHGSHRPGRHHCSRSR